MKILITSAVTEKALADLKSAGHLVIYRPLADTDDVKNFLPEVEGIVINTKTVMDAGMISLGEKLKFIGRLGSGLDIVDLQMAEIKGIAVLNSPEANCNAVGEHTLGMILAFYNKLLQSDQMVRSGTWDREAMRGQEISSKTVGIVGLGYTGTAFFNKLRGFGCSVLYYDPYIPERKSTRISPVHSLFELAEHADIISFHVPLTQETVYMGNKSFFDACHKKPLIVNTSRGKVIRTADLIRALEDQILCGACLDVFENEKSSSYTAEENDVYEALFAREDVLLSPPRCRMVGKFQICAERNIDRKNSQGLPKKPLICC